MRILILAGGLGTEREVSFMSAASVKSVLYKLGHEVIELDPKVNMLSEIAAIKPDIVFNCLHGSYGEDGSIPGLLEVMQIPYTHSGVMSSAIAMNKAMSKKIAKFLDIRIPESSVIRREELFKMLVVGVHPMRFPYVIKPIDQGSTIGVFIIQDASSKLPVLSEWLYGDDILVEQYIPGKEISVAVFNDFALGALELVPKTGFYDYDTKYTEGAAEHIYPAPIPKYSYNEALRFAEVMHKAIGCRTLSRSDFRYNPQEGQRGLYFLELNTHPGFTALSILPEIASYNGITFEGIVMQLLKDAKCEKML